MLLWRSLTLQRVSRGLSAISGPAERATAAGPSERAEILRFEAADAGPAVRRPAAETTAR